MKSSFVKMSLASRRAVEWIKGRVSDEGASLVEYALLLALVAGVAIVSLTFVGHAANNTLQNVGNAINNA